MTDYADLEKRLRERCECRAVSAGGLIAGAAICLRCEAADALSALRREREEARERSDDQYDALQRIKQWCDAYPLDIFPEPDMKAAAEVAVARPVVSRVRARSFARGWGGLGLAGTLGAVLRSHGMTLDAISASNMRHALTGVAKIADDGLRLSTAPSDKGSEGQ